MPNTPSILNERVYRALRRQGMSKQRAARISNAQAHKDAGTVAGASLSGPGGLLSTPGMGTHRKRKGKRWGMREKAANYGARAGETIQGNLGRSASGQFARAGGASSAVPRKPKKGRVPKKPPKVKLTPEQRTAARDAAHQANQGKVLQGLNIAPDGQAALAALRSGAQPDPKAVDRGGFEKAGLVEQAQDGSYRLTSSGRAAMAAAAAGDAGRTGSIISSARDRTSARTGRQAATAARRQATQVRREQAAAAKPAKAASGGAKKPAAAAPAKTPTRTPAQRPVSHASAPSVGSGTSSAPKPKAPSKAPTPQIAQPLKDAAAAVSEGADVTKDQITALVRNGLARLDKDGAPILTAAGLRTTTKAETYGGIKRSKLRENVFAGPDRSFPIKTAQDVKDAVMSLGRTKHDKAAVKAGIIRRAKAIGAMDALPDDWTAKSFTVYKDHTGQHRWLARTTTAYRDRDQEIISSDALDQDSQRMTAQKTFGPLRYWHVGQPDPLAMDAPWGPGLDIGDCDYSCLIGRTRVESGTFRDPQIALKIASQADSYELSPGFFHPLDQPDASGVFHTIRTFERSIVPTAYGRASNLFTGIAVKEAVGITFKAQTPQEKAMFANMGSSGGGGGGSGGKPSGGTGGLYPKGPSGKRTPQAAGASGGAKPEATTETTDATLRQAGLITDKKLIPQEATSLQWYQGVGHDRINAELRGITPVRDQYTLDMTTHNLDAVMDRSKLKRAVEVHRGIYLDTPHAEALLARMQPGKVIRDPSYVSTTVNRDVARRFGAGSVDIRIRVPKGTPAVYMPTAAPRRMTSQGSHNEHELLLARNLKYRVMSRQDSGGATTIELEVVP